MRTILLAIVALFLTIHPGSAAKAPARVQLALLHPSTANFESFGRYLERRKDTRLSVTDTFTFTATTTFTPLHTYFIAASGCSNNNSGTSSGSPWCNPDPVGNGGAPVGFTGFVCGDAIIAAAGTYNGDMSLSAAVGGSCPSVTAGIDGNGGIYMAVLLCAGPDLESCKIDCATAVCNGTGFGPQVGINVSQSHWAVSGFSITCNTVVFCEAMQASGSGNSCAGGKTQFIAFINNKTFKNGQGFDTQACNTANGPDYVAIVANITQDSVRINHTANGICIGAIDIIAPGTSDSDTTHTHFFVYHNYSFNNLVTGCDAWFDGENYLVDSIDNNGVKGHIVHANNIGFFAERHCINWTWDDTAASAAINTLMRAYNNTCYADWQRDTSGTNVVGDFYPACGTDCGAVRNVPWVFQIWNNISFTTPASNGQTGTDHVYTIAQQNQIATGGSVSTGSTIVTGGENILKGSRTSCDTGTTPPYACDSTFSFVSAEAPPPTFTTNIYTNPNFNNVSDLITNRLGVPNCTGFASTTACLGWNWATQTATNPSIIYDLTATCSGCSGKGFQPPAQSCTSVANAATMVGQLVTDFPYYLKGMIGLRWNGTIIQQFPDVASAPCGM